MALPENSAPEIPAAPGAVRLHVIRRVRRAFLSIYRCGDTLFSPYGVTSDQFTLIRAVQREPGIRQTDLGSVIFAEPNTVTAMVTLLERRGVLRRRPSPTDRRAKLIYLTTRGEMLMHKLTSDWTPMRKVLNECFSVPHGQEALEILDAVYERMSLERKKLMDSTLPPQLEPAEFPLKRARKRRVPAVTLED